MNKTKMIVFGVLFLMMCNTQLYAFGDAIRHSNGLLITSGMSKGELMKKFGAPDNRMISQDIAGGVREEWIYYDKGGIIAVVIYNGRVVRVRKD